MAYIEFKPIVKKVNLKKDGVQEIVLEVSNGTLKEKIDALARMIDTNISVALENEYVPYTVRVEKETEKPMIQYEVDDHGIVHEIKDEQEQMELDLGLPAELIPTDEKKKLGSREIIDQFIASGLAPTYDDLTLDFFKIMKMHLEKDMSYLKIASLLNISDGRLINDLDEYRKRLAPLAEPWYKWKVKEDMKKKLDHTEKPDDDDGEGAGAA